MAVVTMKINGQSIKLLVVQEYDGASLKNTISSFPVQYVKPMQLILICSSHRPSKSVVFQTALGSKPQLARIVLAFTDALITF